MKKWVIWAGFIAGFLAMALPSFAQTFAPASSFRNLLIGGDFSTNPFVRGTAAVTAIAATPKFSADHWFGYGAAGSAGVLTRTSTAALLTGATQAMKVQRPNANASVVKLCHAQIIESATIVAAQGKTVSLQVTMLAGANFSAAGLQAEVMIITGTVANEGNVSLAGATWTGQANALDQLQTLTGTFAGYNFTAVIPATALEAAVQVCFTPTGVAGADDSFQMALAQLEIGTAPTQFERRSAGVEAQLACRYAFGLREVTGTSFLVQGQATLTQVGSMSLAVPCVMFGPIIATGSAFGTFFITKADGTSAGNLTSINNGSTPIGTGNSCPFLAGIAAANLVPGNAALIGGQGASGLILCTSEI